MSKTTYFCPQCDTPTHPDPHRPGCEYCPACDEPVIFHGVAVVVAYPELPEARFASVDQAIEAASPLLAKLFARDEDTLHSPDATAQDDAEAGEVAA